MFAEEKPTLLPLPLEPFCYYQYGERIVHLDGGVEVEAAYYGAPPGWIGRVLRVQWDELYVRLLDPMTGLLLREHVRQKRGWYRIKEEVHPKRTPLRTPQLLWRAGRAGSHIGTLCDAIHRQQGEVGGRRILGVLSLAKKYGTEVSQLAEHRQVNTFWLAMTQMALGDRDQTFQLLDRCYEERSPWLTWLKSDPALDPLRSDPRFADLLRRMGLPQ
jgi:hypothetical protein